MQPAIVYGKERDNLYLAARVAYMLSPNKFEYKVENTYFDFGQDWEWTTIIAHRPNSDWGSYQALNPREWEAIVTAETPEEIVATVREMFKDRFCPDKEGK